MRFLLNVVFVLFIFSGFSQNLHVIKSSYLSNVDSILVFVPENYNRIEKYPVVFLLHGYSGNYKTWNKIIPLQEYANNLNFIIVCPDGLYNSWYINSPVRENCQYESFFFMRLIPCIFQKYSVDHNLIFITGLSMGGFGALHLFSNHPGLFNAAGSTSGLLQPELFADEYDINLFFGNSPEKYSLMTNISKFKNIKNELIIDCGTEDEFKPLNDNFYDNCRKKGIPIKYFSLKGSHNREYWKKSIIQHLKYFKQLSDKKT
ncbi:MAG: alpha/beta hydrolase-fold protein [Bacteroidota bacterium]